MKLKLVAPCTFQEEKTSTVYTDSTQTWTHTDSMIPNYATTPIQKKGDSLKTQTRNDSKPRNFF